MRENVIDQARNRRCELAARKRYIAKSQNFDAAAQRSTADSINDKNLGDSKAGNLAQERSVSAAGISAALWKCAAVKRPCATS